MANINNIIPIFFETQNEFRQWLIQNHAIEKELYVGFYKVSFDKNSMTWPESVDQALCFGWVDGVRKSIDDKSYQIRFVPRKKNSIWSGVNIKKVENLIALGLMQPAGLAIYGYRTEKNSKIYAFENEEVALSPEFEKQFKENEIAWSYFQSLAASYKKPSSSWVMSAKQDATKLKRLQDLIADSAAQTNKWKDNKYKKK